MSRWPHVGLAPVVEVTSGAYTESMLRSGGIAAFLAYRASERCSQRTLGNYRSVLVRCEGAVGDLDEATAEELTDWLASLDIGPSSVATYRAALRSYYRWAQASRRVIVNPVDLVPAPRLARRHPRPITPDQFRTALDAADPRMRLWLLLGGLAGLRLSEITMLEAGDIDGTAIRVVHGAKAGHERIVGLHPILAGELAAWPVDVGRLWVVHRSTVCTKIAGHLRACGVDATCHQLRHYFGTEMLRAGADISKVQAAMGHRSPATTSQYCAVVEDLRPWISAIPA